MVKLKTLKKLGDYSKLSEDEWLKLRKNGIGGSEAGGVMGMSKYQSPFSICMSKTNRVEDKDLSENEAVWFGNWMEGHIRTDLVKDFLRDKHGIDAEVIDPECIWQSVKYPFMIVNVDGWLKIGGELCGLEIKTGSSYVLPEWGGVRGSKVPDSYYCQVQHYLAATGLEKWYIFGVIGGKRLLRVVERHDDFIADMVNRERELWATIKKNNPFDFPLVTDLQCDTDIMAEIAPYGEAEFKDHDVKDYLKCAELEKELKSKKAELKNRIMQSLHGNKLSKSEKFSVVVNEIKTSKLDGKKLKEQKPEIYSEFLKEGKQTRFTVKEC